MDSFFKNVYKMFLNSTLSFSEKEGEIYSLIARSNLLVYYKEAPVRVVIPAAGKASRLGGNTAKCLLSPGGIPILIRIMETIRPIDPCPIILVNEINQHMIAKAVQSAGLDAEYVLVTEQIGMGYSILLSENKLKDFNGDVLIIWGDMPIVRYRTISTVCFFHRLFRWYVAATMPTIIVDNPYIAAIRNDEGEIEAILQKREGDLMPDRGENDCGIFMIKSQDLFLALNRLWEKYNEEKLEFQAAGGEIFNKEFTLLQIFPYLQSMQKHVICLPIADSFECRSINTLEDLEIAEEYYEEIMYGNA